MKQYKYDVFLSFTGADRELKNSIKAALRLKKLEPYDSDENCSGQFRPDFCRALDQSRVYLMILTDNLRNDPNVTGRGCFTEVRREGNLASQLEAAGELNIVILTMSEFFRFDSTFHDYHDMIGWHFYSLTRGFSQVMGEVEPNGALTQKTMDEVLSRCLSFVEKRNAGEPVPSQAPKLEIAAQGLPERGIFKGRERELNEAVSALSAGARAVVLSGLGGIGKTTLATEIARRLEEEGYLRCPQIVTVRELGDRRDGLQTIVSSVSYDRCVYDSLASLPERDRYERKLAALTSLPETVLLVVDNYNALAEENLRAALSRLRCRLLITTRATLPTVPAEVSVIPVDSLSEEEAYEMFSEVLGEAAPREEFLQLYRFTGGHTITLCIMARMAAAHRIPIAELLGRMDGLASFDARIDFRHNEYGDSDTILGHLSRLFDMAGFGEGCLRILRSLSLLGNGTIPLADLVATLSLPNRNDLLTLERGGWIQLRRRDGEAGGEEVYLHPIIARLVAGLLLPNEENTAEMIAYLMRAADAAKEGMTYADAATLSDGLYYACHVLAGSSHRLSQELFARFTELDHLLGNATETTEKVRGLAARIDNEQDLARVTAYGDMVTLEQSPMRVDILERYLGHLLENADDYKWVLRALSVTFVHLETLVATDPALASFLTRALVAAVEAAKHRRDDFALADLYTYAIRTNNKAAVLPLILPYLRERRRAGEKGATLRMLELNVMSSRMVDIENAGEFLSAFSEGKLWKLAWPFLRHPGLVIRSHSLIARIRRLGDDPVAMWLKTVVGQGEQLALEGQIDARAMIEAAVNLHTARIEHHTTLASAALAIRGVLDLLRSLPAASVRRAADELVAGVEEREVTVHSLSVLQVAALVNGANRNRAAVEQSRSLVSVVRRLRPDGHNDVLDALLGHASLCTDFGMYEEAQSAYFTVYDHLLGAAPGSSKLSEVAYFILRLPVSMTVERLRAVRDTALAATEVQGYRYFEILNAYLIRLLATGEREAVNAELAVILGELRTGASQVRTSTAMAQQTALYLLDTIAASAPLTDEAREEVAELVRAYSASRHARIRVMARLQLSRLLCARLHREEGEPAALIAECRRALAAAVKAELYYQTAAESFYYAADTLLDADPEGFPTALFEDEAAAVEAEWQRDRAAALLRRAAGLGESDEEIAEGRLLLSEEIRPLLKEMSTRTFGLSREALVGIRTADGLATAMLNALFAEYRRTRKE